MDNFLENCELDTEPYLKVYILESPSDIDLLQNRREGKALSEVLKISEIPFDYYLIASKEAFQSAISEIKEDISDLQDSYLFVWPIIHVSCHGCETGIGLTDRAFIPWTELYKHLADINLYFEEVEVGAVSPILLSMSSCYGLHAIKEDWNEDRLRSEFAFVLGHENKISWSDALIAFSVFFYQFVNKKSTSEIALKCMNDSINRPDYFKLLSSKDYQKLVTDTLTAAQIE